MTSKTAASEGIIVNSPSKLSVNKGFGPKKINPIFKRNVKIDPTTLKQYTVKRFKAYLWKYGKPPEDYNRAPIYKIYPKDLAPILKETRRFGEFCFGDFWLHRVKDSELPSLVKSLKGKTSIRMLLVSKGGGHKGIQNLKRGLKGPRSLKKLKVEFDKESEKEIQQFRHGIKSNSDLQEISLSLGREMTDKDIEKFGRDLQRLPCLKNIELCGSHNKKITGTGLQKFGQSLKKLKHLKNLDLDFCVLLFTEEGMYSLGQCLNALASIENIKLRLYSHEMIEILSSVNGFEHLRLLKNLKLEFYGTDMTDEGMLSLGKGIEKLVHLENLHFEIAGGMSLTNQGISDLGHGLGKLSNLKSLSLHLYRPLAITDEGMFDFGRRIGELINLKTLDLNFIDLDNVSDEGLLNFGLAFAKLSSLENLNFTFNGTGKKITDMKILEQLKGLTSLQNLELWLKTYYLIDAALDNLGRGLATLNSLQNLKIKFVRCENLKGKKMKGFGTGLKSLGSLKTLDIIFSDCFNFKGLGLPAFSEGLKGLTSLQALTLTFGQSRGFHHACVQLVAEGIKSLVSLETLNLLFGFRRGSTNVGMRYIGESLRSLLLLKNLEFHAYEYDLTDSGIQSLIEGWSNLPLENINLGFSGDYFTATMIHDLGKCLNKINTLKSLDLYISVLKKLRQADKEAFKQAVDSYRWIKNDRVYF